MFLLLVPLPLVSLKLMEGSAKIISLIARDENQHLAITQNILNKWRDGDDPEMKQIAKEEEEWVYKMFDRAVNEEKRWADYLFKDGSMIGLNDKLLQKYVEWIANRRLKGPLVSNQCMTLLQQTIHCLGLNIGFLPRVFRLHLKKQKSNPMLLEVSSKMSKKTRSQDSNCSGNCKCNCVDWDNEAMLQAYREVQKDCSR